MHDLKLYGTATIGTKGQLVIPAEARDELQFGEGDKMVVLRVPHGEGLMIIKAEKVEAMLGHMYSQLQSVTKEAAKE